jgi:DNA modification methylase
MAGLGEHLNYVWMVALLLGDSLTPRRCELKIQARRKPLLLYSKGGYKPLAGRTAIFQGRGKQKEYHPWQRPEEECEYYVSRLTRPGDRVVDYFGGSMTTAAVCKRLGRRRISCDVEKGCVVMGQERLSKI